MSSLSVFDPARTVLEFLSIQAERIGGRQLDIELVHSKKTLRVARLAVDMEARKAFYATEKEGALTEFSSELLFDIGGVKVV
ncbi:MAG: hypothetical protein LBE89_06685 [Helicobacteraceae bacterium]|jgi:hypothetical protein|nr:hypothetical protein [Helicobacteraceae bacterium]